MFLVASEMAVMVMVDNDIKKSVDIPQYFRSAVAAFEQNEDLAKQ